MTLVKFNPEKTNSNLLPGFSDVFQNFFNDSFLNDRMVTRVPAANISESSDHYHIELAAPGLKKDDFKLQLDDHVLSISVEQMQNDKQQERSYSKREYSYSSFVRSFTLPESADEQQIDARYEHGILMIDIAKKEEAKSVRRQIEIQ